MTSLGLNTMSFINKLKSRQKLVTTNNSKQRCLQCSELSECHDGERCGFHRKSSLHDR